VDILDDGMTEELPAPVVDKPVTSCKKRKAETAIPQLIDNKRKHMERQLSAAQRDQLLLQESKEDSKFKKDMTEAIKQSDQTFANAMQQMSQSIVQVAESLTQSLRVIGQGFMQPNNQHAFTPYHHPNRGLNASAAIYNNFGTHQFNFEDGNSQMSSIAENNTYHSL